MSEVPRPTLYGIANCDTVRRTRAWLAANGVDVLFHDFKKAGLSSAQVERWRHAIGWEPLVNRKGTTWRNLPDCRREAVIDAGAAQTLMLEFPSVVKRPVLEIGGAVVVGFDEKRYRSLFDAS